MLTLVGGFTSVGLPAAHPGAPQPPLIEPRQTPEKTPSSEAEQPAEGADEASADSPPPSESSKDQPPTVVPPDNTPVLSVADVDEMLAAADADATIADEVRSKAKDLLGQARTELEATEQRRKDTAFDAQKILEAPETASQLREKLSSPPERISSAEFDEETSLDLLLPEQARLQPVVQASKEAIGSLDAEEDRRAKRRLEIVDSQSTRSKRKGDLDARLALAPPSDQPEILTNARRILYQAQLQKLETEPAAFQAELGRYDAEKAVDLISLQTQIANRRLKQLQGEVERLNQIIATKRRNDARYASRQLQLFAEGKSTVSPYARSGDDRFFAGKLTSRRDLSAAAATAVLARKNVSKTDDLSSTIREVVDARKELEALQATRSRLLEKIARVGETGAIGLELRKELSSLRNTRGLQKSCDERQDTMRDLEFTRIELEDLIREQQLAMDRLDDAVAENAESIQLRLLFDSLMTARAAEKTYGEYFNRLADLDAFEQELVRETEDFRSFIQTRVLWIRSNRAPEPADITEAGESLAKLFSTGNWRQVAVTIQHDLRQNLGVYVLLSGLLVLLIFVQTRFRRTLTEIGDVVSRRSCREFTPTARATVLTCVIAFPWPFVMGFFGWRLYTIAPVGSFTAAAGRGFLSSAMWFLALNLLRQVCKPKGLARAHFGWSDVFVPKLRSRLYGLILIMLPVIFAVTMLHYFEYPTGRDALERCIFVFGMAVLARFLVRVLNPQRGVFRSYLAANPDGWVRRFQWCWYIIAVGAPIFLIGLTLFGYFYTAFELSWRLLTVTWIVVGLLIARGFFFRWFIVSHRRLRMEQTRQRLRAQAEAAANTTESSPEEMPVASSPLARAQEESEELDEVSDQTERFIDSGLAITGLLLIGFIWVDVIQALDVLNEVHLWSTMVDVSVEKKTAEGLVTIQTEPQLKPITISNVFFAILFGCITYTAARNVPGLLQMILLQKLPLHPASRYAVRMVARYVIVVVGTIVTFAQIGVGWSKVQWLAAALTVGLGFGLQEIFANFVSGMIILFERPVRIGDVVTIGDVTGVVSRIQIRATTITDWDRKEYIVPNKEFVTGRLLNWTLTDQTNRVVVSVGVAYGTDTNLARSLLLQAAADHPLVLTDPGPIATFESFGDSTLDLLLRCYLPDLDNRLSVITALHESIDRLFQEANIEISFPQQDLYIRSLPDSPGI